MSKGKRHVPFIATANRLNKLRKLLQDGEVGLQPRHKYGCSTYFTAIHPCDCGAEEKYKEAKKLAGTVEEDEHEAGD